MIGYLIAYFFAGLFVVNGVPHFVMGICGDEFPTPFAKPPGKGKSSPRVNVLWGSFNFIVGYILLYQVGGFDPRSWLEFACFAFGGFLIAFLCAPHFAKRDR